MGRSCPSDAAGDRKEMAYQGFPALLAMEVIQERWAAPHFQADAEPDLPNEQGESPMECRKDQGHAYASPVRPTLRGYNQKIHVQVA
jgi:hypothetical protein